MLGDGAQDLLLGLDIDRRGVLGAFVGLDDIRDDSLAIPSRSPDFLAWNL